MIDAVRGDGARPKHDGAAERAREHRIAVVRSARYYTLGAPEPASSPRPTDVWIACHGYGQLACDFIAGLAAVAEPGRVIVAPEGLSRFYLDRTPARGGPPPRVGATWMTREDRDAEIADHVEYLDAVCDAVRNEVLHGAERARVRLRALGFSQGVATVGRWLARGRTRADEMIVWAGSFPPDVDASALRNRFAGTTVTIVVGTRDTLAGRADAEALAQRFSDAGISTRLRSFDGGHRLDDHTLRAVAAEEPVGGA